MWVESEVPTCSDQAGETVLQLGKRCAADDPGAVVDTIALE
jgi:hypothetical protein